MIVLVVFIHFLRLRYYLSEHTKEAIQITTLQLDKWLLLPSSPTKEPVIKSSKFRIAAISNAYIHIKKLIIQVGDISYAYNKPQPK